MKFKDTIDGSIAKNSATATKLATARTITIGSKGKTFDGSDNVSWSLSEIGAAASSHNHDDRYYTESEINTKVSALQSEIDADVKVEADRAKAAENTLQANIDKKADKSHGNHVPTTQTASNSVFLRNDNTWQTVTPGNIGAYTKTEIDSKVTTINTAISGKADKSHGNHVPATQTANNAVFLRNDNTWQTVTPANIGAATSSHGTHVTYATATPAANGTAAVGSSGKVAREDHVHPLQTTISGNAGSATKLATAREIKIGNKTNTFNGTGNITYTLADIGAAPIQTKSAATAATAQWYRIATSAASINNCLGLFEIEAAVSGKHSVTLVSAGISYGITDGVNLQQLSHTAYSAAGITKARIVYHTSYNSNYAYLEVYLPSATATTITVNLVGGRGWTLVAPSTTGSIPSGYTNKEITFAANKLVSNVNGSVSGNAGTATKLATKRTITIGNKGQDFDGSAAISFTLSDIGAATSGHTHNYAGSSSAGGAATSANKVNQNITIKLNGGGTEGTNLFTFNGSAAKSINITPSSIGAAASSHGTHVGDAYATATPKANGTAAIGTSAKIAREDHVHPLQTTVSGNAGSATKLATARSITIGNKANSFDGTGNISYSLADIGAAAASHSHTLLESVDSRNVNGAPNSYTARGITPEFKSTSTIGLPESGKNFAGVITYQQWSDTSSWSGGKTTQFATLDDGRMYYRKGEGTAWGSWGQFYTTTHKPTYSDVGAAKESHGTHVTYATGTPKANGTAAIGSVNRVAREDHVHPLQTSVSGNAGTATTLATARNITIGNKTNSFNGSANISFTLADIGASASGHTHNYAGSSSAGGAANSATKLATAREITVGNKTNSFNGTANISFTLADIGAEPLAKTVVSKSKSGTTLTLSKDRYQKASLASGDTIALPSATTYTEIELFVKDCSLTNINLPDNCKWRVDHNLSAGTSFIIRFVYTTQEWLGEIKIFS
jgi:hypothetical protein